MTLVNGTQETPCELAGRHGHAELASQLETLVIFSAEAESATADGPGATAIQDFTSLTDAEVLAVAAAWAEQATKESPLHPAAVEHLLAFCNWDLGTVPLFYFLFRCFLVSKQPKQPAIDGATVLLIMVCPMVKFVARSRDLPSLRKEAGISEASWLARPWLTCGADVLVEVSEGMSLAAVVTSADGPTLVVAVDGDDVDVARSIVRPALPKCPPICAVCSDEVAPGGLLVNDCGHG